MGKSSPRLRSRLNWPAGKSGPQIPSTLEPLMCALETKNVDKSRILHTSEVVDHCHEGQMCKLGEPYITHPVTIVVILTELGMDEDTIIGAPLHDTVEDTNYQLSDLRREFGPAIEVLVDGITKPDKVEYSEATQAETVRKTVITVPKDAHILPIKPANRLHNVRTRKYVSTEGARRKARETLEVYAPLAHRLGMNSIEWELEDRPFRVLYPTIYGKIKKLITDRTLKREAYALQMRGILESKPRNAKIKCTITRRLGHYCSIYQRMILHGKDFEDIYDPVSARVLVKTIADCYVALGVTSTTFIPTQDRIKDYIATPRFNFYQPTHTTVIDPDGRTMEIRIRTYDMHKRTEYGVVTHWWYKEDTGQSRGGVGPTSEEQTQLNWFRQPVDRQCDMADPAELLGPLRYEISGGQVHVFTLKGEALELPAGSTSIDFAYTVHMEVGHHTVGARISDRLVTLNRRLKSGDNAGIITAKNPDAEPSHGWLDFVAFQWARAKIKAQFKHSCYEEFVDSGKDKPAKAICRKNQPVQRLMSHDTLWGIAQNLNKNDVTDLYAAIGEGVISAETVVRHFIQTQGGEPDVEETLPETVTPTHIAHHFSASSDSVAIVESMDSDGVLVKLVKCCTPAPPDVTVGFVMQGNGLLVHRVDCPDVLPLERGPERFIDVAWSEGSEATYPVQVQIEELDRQDLLSGLSHILSEHGINVLQGTMTITKKRISKSSSTLEMTGSSHLGRILREFRKVNRVYDTYRMTGSKKGSERRV